MVSAYELLVNRLRPADSADLSRLFVYYNIREAEGLVESDSGAYIRDGMKAVAKYGVCTEALWPYNIERFAVKPSSGCYVDAEKRKIVRYYKLTGVSQLLDAINDNRPVVFGITTYDNFDRLKGKNSVLSVPLNTSENLGGHAMCMVGYNTNRQLFLAKNSFGTDWGDQGYCWITYDYIKSEGYDMWTFDIQ